MHFLILNSTFLFCTLHFLLCSQRSFSIKKIYLRKSTANRIIQEIEWKALMMPIRLSMSKMNFLAFFHSFLFYSFNSRRNQATSTPTLSVRSYIVGLVLGSMLCRCFPPSRHPLQEINLNLNCWQSKMRNDFASMMLALWPG